MPRTEMKMHEGDCAVTPVPRLLVVEDNPADAHLVRAYAVEAWGGDGSTVVDTLTGARSALDDGPVDCILLDLSLPDAQGLEGIAMLSLVRPEIPIVVITGAPQRDALVLAALAEGAQDYLAKDGLTAGVLRTTVERALFRKRASRRADAAGKVPSAVLNAIDSPTVAVDRTGMIVAINEAWVRAAALAGFDASASGIGAGYLDLVGAVTGLSILEIEEISDGIVAVDCGDTDRFTLDYVTPIGQGGWSNLRVSPLGGVGDGVILVHTDITETRLAEEAMRLNGAALGDLVADVSQLFVMLDERGAVIHVSDRTQERLDLDPAQLVCGGDAVHPADHDKAKRAYAAALASPGERQRTQLRVRFSDGRWRRLVVVITNLLDLPAVGAVVLTGNDVSDDREKRIARHFDGVFLDRLPAAVIVTDDVGVVAYWNVRAAELLGHTREEAMGRDIRELTGGEDFASVYDRPVMSAADGRWEGEATAMHVAGHEVPVLMTLDHVAIGDIGFDGIVATLLDNTERKHLEASLTYQAMHDPLTGLPNRGLFVDRLGQALARRSRMESTVAVLFLDLDRFKIVNDTVGHKGGDEILRVVGRRLQAVLRPEDTISRLGGDEFTVCCEDLSSPAEAATIAGRLLAALDPPIVLDDREHVVNASVGIAIATGRQSERPETMVQDADAAMYKAKSSGRGTFRFFDESDRSENARRTRLTADLRHALDRDELRLQYQPVYDLASRRVVGAEALLRWEHPQLGRLTPDDFIGIAEDSSLIVTIGRWVMDTALSELARWQRVTPESRMTMAVNVSARQVSNSGLVEMVRSLLDEHDIEPARLCLELTETTLLGDVDNTVEVLRGLRSLGVQLAIDDFGTGYSSLAYLKRFPIDFLKIDRSFVQDMSTNTDDLAIVKAVVDLAGSLGLAVIAEGVEVEEHAVELEAMGCGFAQGHLWSPATDPDDLLALIGAEPVRSTAVIVPPHDETERGQTDVVAMLTHEISTPLAVVLASLDLLPVLDADEQVAILDAARRNCRSAIELVRSLTDAHLVEGGSIELHPSRIDLAVAARDSVRSYRSIAPDRRITLDVVPGQGWVDADPLRVDQIISNLIGNALKYSPADTEVAVVVAADDRDVRFEVTDAGGGIPADRLAEVFRKFGRLSRGATGVGLGLYLARRLARAHGGEVTYVPSPRTNGSTFVLQLPAADVAVAADTGADVRG